MKTLSFLILILTLCACSTQPGKFRYYQFTAVLSADESDVQLLENIQQIRLNLTVPDYLKQNKMVMKMDNNELRFAQLHLWAQLPAKAIYTELQRELNQTAENWFIATGSNSPVRSGMALQVNIHEFYPTLAGDALISGDWMFSVDGAPLMRMEFYNKTPLKEVGYSHALQALSQLLTQLSHEINGQIEKEFLRKAGHAEH